MIYTNNMRIINILQIISGIPNQIESFPIFEEQLSQDVVEAAENCFIEMIYGKDWKNVINEEEKELLLDEANYDDHNGHEVYIIWSN